MNTHLSLTFALLISISVCSQAAPIAPCTEEVGTVQPGFGTYVVATASKNYFLQPGQCLISPNRQYMAVLQASDGNFVYYSIVNGVAKYDHWSTKTGGNPNAGLLVQQDGHFVVYRAGAIVVTDGHANGDPTKAIFQSNPAINPYAAYLLAMQDDANLVLYPGTSPASVGKYLFSSRDQLLNAPTGGTCSQWTCWNDPVVGQQCAFLPKSC